MKKFCISTDTPPAPELSVAGQDQGIVKLNIKAQVDKHVEEELLVTGFKVEYILASETWDSAVAQDFHIGKQYIKIFDLRHFSLVLNNNDKYVSMCFSLSSITVNRIFYM